ncbi:hypothetical protein V1477_015931 [Vespula maculifrons]|uniref:Uncharacterized protein n=1 Tax=Vespula maculifrons TaxID=7453 RepID=A0ABD2BBP0_VESMC
MDKSAYCFRLNLQNPMIPHFNDLQNVFRNTISLLYKHLPLYLQKTTKDRTPWHKIKVNYGGVEWYVVHDVSMSASFARSTKRVSRGGSYKSSSVSAWMDASRNRSEIVEEYRSVFRKKKVDEEDAWRTKENVLQDRKIERDDCERKGQDGKWAEKWPFE